MNLLQANRIEKQYDGHEILRGANLAVQSKERVALVGQNGAGKSTLLRIVIGEENPDAGEVSLARGASLGYVSQFVSAQGQVTVYDYVAESFQAVFDMENRMRGMEKQMSDPAVYRDEQQFLTLSESYDRLQHEFLEAGGYSVSSRIRRVLDGLSFPAEMHQLSVESLSGGQKTRLSLARLLAMQPDLLVLDEPTNYLDTDTLSWLEDYLQSYDGAVLVVSHDRYFLDKVATALYELENGQTARYTGNYSDFIEQKAARQEQEQKRYEAQQKDIARMEEFVQRNIVRASTTKRAQSRRKLLERMERIERPSANVPKLALNFECARTSGKDVLSVQDAVLGYPGKRLAGPLNLEVHRGQRVAVIGPNGVGKTTFLKALTGDWPPQSGSVHWGVGVELGYYDQEQKNLDSTKTVLEQIHDEYPGLDLTTVRTALGRFLFRGEDVQKPVAALSGGERSRLSLCRLMLQQANVLVLDEPTNHLDLLSKEVLEDALDDYPGTILFVSHDRYFIDALASHVAVLGESGFTLYIGNYTEYQTKKAADEKWAEETAASEPSGRAKRSNPSLQGFESVFSGPSRQENLKSPALSGENDGGEAPKRRVVRSADLRKLRERVQQLEARISEIEDRQQAIGDELVSAGMEQDLDTVQKLNLELEALGKEHEVKLTEWEQAAFDLEELESGL
ncbi:ABC-F family ATP-binding cassette domain-containing protein [Alicyclobacillus tolerans]|uniref:ABC-F family ATP-binding cassette domain-containing protein n=1 Tax=Alicyclobacillus tolerans TaxID=90970 RepID=UPI001F42D01B|nr:ABC-F family ATP-binding cassette domain-containing protein [Alicyclobacillus tolerans]MCF8566351.1 ABC-F family ATP-binding cassette domain-containing protein [Alicyclobacillus tolerans]